MVSKGRQFKAYDPMAYTSLTATTPEFLGDCDGCGGRHPAEPSHDGQHGDGQIYAVVCPEDLMTQYHTREGIEPYVAPKRKRRR